METATRAEQRIAGWIRRPRRLIDIALLYLVYAAFVVLTLCWSVLALLARMLLPPENRPLAGALMVGLTARTFLRLMWATGRVHFDLRALDHLRSEGPMVLAANHPSLIDAVLILSRLPGAVCITKAQLFDNLLLGSGLRLAGFIRNDSPLRTVKEARGRLRGGRQLLIFPEGTRTSSQPVDRFKPGLALMAKLAAVPVQTIFIEPSCDFLAKGRSPFRLPPLPLVYRLRLGRRFVVGEDIQQFTSELEAYFKRELGA